MSNTSLPLTAALGNFLQEVRFDQLPAEAVALARDAFTDTIAVVMAGVDEPVVKIVRDQLLIQPAPAEARACLSPLHVSALDAALISGTAAHAHDYDDQALTGHPSAILVPAILSEAELVGSSGRDMVTAYVAGYEVWAELVRRASNYHSKGWHPTSVFGVIAAAAAACVLKRLSAERAAAALAIAASHAAGLAVNFGTMTKPYHAGMSARNGLVSARMAAAGATAATDALENRHGFLTAFTGETVPDWDSPVRLGREWYLPRTRLCIKRYPTCYFMHRSFEATAKLLSEHPTAPEQIAEIEVTMGRGQTAVLVNTRPQTGLQAKFSEHFAMAAAVILGRMGIAELSDEVVQRADIQAFFAKVKLNAVDEYDERDPAHSPTERVVLRLQDGTRLDTGPITSIPGHANQPLTTEQLWTKFKECTAKTHSHEAAQLLFERSQSIVELRSTQQLPTCENVFRDRHTAIAAQDGTPEAKAVSMSGVE